MPSPGFFQRLGLFVLPDFIDLEFSAELCRAMSIAPSGKALLVGAAGESRLDEQIRRVDGSLISEKISSPLTQRLRGLIPNLQEHFGIELENCEPPQYLIYRTGDFFKPHVDGGCLGTSEETRRRRVSVVIFLNRESKEAAADAYGQGQLKFYGFLDGTQWKRCGLPLAAEPGLLLAFPSDRCHEVTPVSHGTRFTIVTWFYGPKVAIGGERAN